jgi:hypothetical protein
VPRPAGRKLSRRTTVSSAAGLVACGLALT